MSPRGIRALVLVVFIGGIAGMIIGSIADNNGVAITFGLVTAGAAVALILVTAVAGPGGFVRSEAGRASRAGDDAAGALVEEQVEVLVGAGADERAVRELVRRTLAYAKRTG